MRLRCGGMTMLKKREGTSNVLFSEVVVGM